MTRKDYTLIAAAVERMARHESKEGRQAIYGVVHALAHDLRRDNERFERARFMAACGFPVTE